MAKQSTPATASATSEIQTPGEDAAALLKKDHKEVKDLFQKFEASSDTTEKATLVRQICKSLIIHAMIEEEIFYPACTEAAGESIQEAHVEHDSAKILIAELMSSSPEDEYFDAKVKVLSEYVNHHVAEEEKPGTGIIARAKKGGVNMSALGAQLKQRKEDLQSSMTESRLPPPQPTTLHASPTKQKENYAMPQQNDRDERGRFVSDDDRGGRRSSRYEENGRRGSRYEDDDDGRSSRGGGYARSRRDDDDNDYRSGGGRGERGWSGDYEGHSEASRRGWEGRRSGDDDYEGGRGSRSSGSSRYDDEDDRSGGRGRSSGGRGHGGWFGDSESHSQASREGWESRGGGGRSSRGRDDDDDDRGGSRSSRSRNDDDYDRGGSSRSSGRGHGGWFGDSRGHAEAARRGWRDRD